MFVLRKRARELERDLAAALEALEDARRLAAQEEVAFRALKASADRDRADLTARLGDLAYLEQVCAELVMERDNLDASCNELALQRNALEGRCKDLETKLDALAVRPAPRETEGMSPENLSADVIRSDASGESLNDWWNRAHERDHQYWLTGSDGAEVWERLGVRSRLSQGVRVLNIGVGLGQDTRQLAAMGCEVHALDISPVALDRVRGLAVTHLASDLDRLPRDCFDVAMSHLVAQHMLDFDLLAQMKAVLLSLTSSGVFAIQFATGAAAALEQTSLQAKGGSIHRTPEQMERLVAQAGGLVALSEPREQFPEHRAGWHVMHVVRP
jgi:SAM-dependent methyltransferase